MTAPERAQKGPEMVAWPGLPLGCSRGSKDMPAVAALRQFPTRKLRVEHQTDKVF
jgi:hypothetical protein